VGGLNVKAPPRGGDISWCHLGDNHEKGGEKKGYVKDKGRKQNDKGKIKING
jgi:hypothetical protein